MKRVICIFLNYQWNYFQVFVNMEIVNLKLLAFTGQCPVSAPKKE